LYLSHTSLSSLELDAITTRTQNLSEETVQHLKELREKINNIQQDIRQFSHELYPAILDDSGLEPALEKLVVEFNGKGCWIYSSMLKVGKEV